MITISTGNYSTTELKVLLTGIFRAQYLLCQSEGCKLERCCKAPCKSYTMCTEFLYPNGKLNEERLEKGMVAKDFFMHFYNSDCDRIAIENPIPSKVYGLPPYTQTIQPWMFGHPVQKKTCLWLKGLPELQPTNVVEERQSTKIPGNWFNSGGKERQKNRAKTFPGIAKAMAEQWGEIL